MVSPTVTPDPTPTPSQVQARPFTLAYDPTATLHPITGENEVNLALAPLVYEGLYRLDETFTPQPVLAAQAQVDESALVWTITLAEGVVFSDGTHLTAAHVASSLNAARSSTVYAARLSAISSVQGRDGAVVITLTAPNGSLPALLDVPIVLETGDGPLGTGRYRFARDEEELRLQINYNHGDDVPYDEIPLHAVTGGEARIDAFNTGAVSAVTTTWGDAYALGYGGVYESWDYATPELIYVGFRAAGGACANATVRRALSLALDRTALVAALGGHGDEATLPISPLHGEYDQTAADTLSYDIEEAAALLEQAGYRLGEDGLRRQGRTAMTLTLLVNSDNAGRVAAAGLLAETLTGLGVTVTVSSLPWREYLTALTAGRFDLYLAGARLTGDFDPTSLLTGALNYGGYNAAPLTQALSQWRAAAGEERLTAAGELWTAFAQQAPLAPVAFLRASLLVRGGMVAQLSPCWGDPFYNMENWQPVTD